MKILPLMIALLFFQNNVASSDFLGEQPIQLAVIDNDCGYYAEKVIALMESFTDIYSNKAWLECVGCQKDTLTTGELFGRVYCRYLSSSGDDNARVIIKKIMDEAFNIFPQNPLDELIAFMVYGANKLQLSCETCQGKEWCVIPYDKISVVKPIRPSGITCEEGEDESLVFYEPDWVSFNRYSEKVLAITNFIEEHYPCHKAWLECLFCHENYYTQEEFFGLLLMAALGAIVDVNEQNGEVFASSKAAKKFLDEVVDLFSKKQHEEILLCMLRIANELPFPCRECDKTAWVLVPYKTLAIT